MQCTFALSRRFYPKRLTGYSGYTFFIIMCVPREMNLQPFALLTQCSTTEPQEHCRYAGFQFNIIKNYMLGVFQLRLARCDLYYIFTVTDRFRPKQNTGVGGNGSHSSGSGTAWDFPQIFQLDWDGMRFCFVGVGQERFENPCRSLLYHSLQKKGELLEACPGRS